MTLEFILVMALYMIPTIVAMLRGHKSQNAIAFVNFFLGWSIIGWLWAMIWALTGNTHLSRMAS